MNNIEDILRKKHDEINDLEIPDELETRLRSVLNKHPQINIKRRRWKTPAIAAMLIVFIFLTYNIDTLAYYGKKIIGYDQVMSGTLKQLNELGKGQSIGKSYTFKSGTVVILDGVMLDDNQLLAFYTIKSPKGNLDNGGIEPFMTMKGFFKDYYMKSGEGHGNNDNTEAKWISSFESPKAFEKKLKLYFVEKGGRETGEIDFILDRNEAMGHTLKCNINKGIKVDDTNIRFDSILSSPTTTVIKGTIKNIVELALDQLSGERLRPQEIGVKLIANGKEVALQGGGISTDINGSKFNKSFDPLPSDLKSLQIKLYCFGADHDVKGEFELKKGEGNNKLNVLSQNIEINNVYESKGETCVTITTEENVLLTKVYLIIDGKRTALKETVTDNMDKKINGIITHTRTLHFLGTGSDLKLDIQRMKYNKLYNEVIDIPVE